MRSGHKEWLKMQENLPAPIHTCHDCHVKWGDWEDVSSCWCCQKVVERDPSGPPLRTKNVI